MGFPPGPGRGSRLSLEKARTQRVAGGCPPPPPFLSPARSHSLVLALGATLFGSIGYFGAHLRTLIWKPSFPKMLSSIFFLENASQIGLSIPDVTAPLSYQRQRSPKRANESERAIKTRVQGGALVFFPPTFSKESRAPPPESAGPPGALRPKGGFGAAHPKGTRSPTALSDGGLYSTPR